MSYPNGAEPVPDPRLTVNAGRFWAGAAATAVVAALIGLVGVVVLFNVFDVDLDPINVLDAGSLMGTYTLHGFVAAILAAGLLHLLIVTTPRPLAFFGWIMALATAVAAVLPFGYADLTTAVATAGLNIVIGAAVWSLLAGVARMTTARRVPPVDPAVPPPGPPQAPPRRPPSY
ncbi:hypothetical protein Bcav_1421 [Beutenbergia cavernae DSM 12333]|uniref:Uncharacterized protein n=1 Tax=Beutenbergia cavernae (strain ATCC BAA-8 / DSM 12333 / CCUG 43141 / JCM 11478 / NBRC 16432 / NCIMB 13614 / HKI 0122) TaxID=471853 RepID=C5C2J3_BEUC1|nr:DUF6069 family protein [Beutenbergia cavernae]ACQ79679.1 hypothetical protein Bcav_1421 [Beutenbergia cavernae DSM 12333]